MQLLDQARAEGRQVLDELVAKSVLAAYGLKVPNGIRVLPGAVPELDGLVAPFVAKLISPDLPHKSDVGGVRVGLLDASAARSAARDLEELARALKLRLDGVLIEEMAPPGLELVVGGIVDARFGPVLMLGLGGVFVEIFKDTAFRICPITRRDAVEMIGELRGVSILRGARGRKAVDENLIVSMLLAIGGDGGLLLELENEITELDVNPIIVSENDVYACDARMVLAAGTGGVRA